MIIKKSVSILIIFICIFANSGCQKKEPDNINSSISLTKEKAENFEEHSDITQSKGKKGNQMIATVNGITITQSEIDREVENLIYQMENTVSHEKMNDLQPMLQKHALDNLINHILLKQKAEEEGIVTENKAVDDKIAEITKEFSSPEQFKKQLKSAGLSEEKLRQEINDSLKIETLLKDSIASAKESSNEDIENFYKDNKGDFQVNEQIRVSHILLDLKPDEIEETREEKYRQMTRLRDEIDKGADFAELAKQYSACPSKTKGGDLGFFAKGKMVPSFEDAAFKLKLGEVSEIIETQYGYHLIKLTDQKAQHTIPLDMVKDKVKNYLDDLNKQKVIRDYIDKLRSSATIKLLKEVN